MSDQRDRVTTFCCYYGGQFEEHNGELSYLGGGTKFIYSKGETVLAALVNELPISLYGQKVTYKVPFDPVEERRLLVNGHPNFHRMIEATYWTGVIDIYVEPDIERNEPEVDEERTEAGHGNAIRFTEEDRVERDVGDYTDDGSNDAEYDTPEDSDVEGGGKKYCKYKKGSGEFELGQIFDCLEDFKDVVLDYSLKNPRNVHYCRWDVDKSELRCFYVPEEGKEPCLWRLYCSIEVPIKKWMVKTFQKNHSCPETRFSKIITDEVIAKMFINDIRDDYKLFPKRIQRELEKRWKKVASIDQCRNARRKALKMIQMEHDEQFSRLRDYRIELLRSNEGSTVELETVNGDDGHDHFLRLYVCFAALRNTWCTYCRPIVGLNGCFLKCTMKGKLLAAVGRDANNQMYPIAWAVVDKENEDNWMWFIAKLQTDLRLGDGSGFSVISDRQKGLLNAVSFFLPKVEHRMCARHIYANLKKHHPDRAEMKKLFWKVAKSYNKAHYEIRKEKVLAYDAKVWESMMSKNPENCSLAYFDVTACCDDVSNNISEAFNNAINAARELPMVEMLETIRRRAMMRIESRRKKSQKHRGTFSLNSRRLVDLEKQKVNNCIAYSSSATLFEVKEKNCSFMVDLRKRTCACRKWDMSGLPCRHVLKVIEDKKLNDEGYMSNCYLTSRWRAQYSENILHVLGVKFWPKTDDQLILPPKPPVTHGRQKVQKRIKEKNESPKKKKQKVTEEETTKVSREKRLVQCGKCSWIGHNRKNCQNVVINQFRKPRKKKSVVNASDLGEESSQPTQSQVID